MERESIKEVLTERLRRLHDRQESTYHALGELWNYKTALEETATVAITDLKGVITSVNRKFCELTGYSAEELVGQSHRMLSSGYHTKEFYRDLWQTISTGEIWRGEIRNRHRSGRAYWSTMTIIPFRDPAGRIYQYVSIRSDISALKEAEAEHLRLLDAQKKLNLAEEAVLNRDRFVSMASHELKTPISALQLRIEGGLRKIGTSPTGLSCEEQTKILKTALAQTKRLTGMIDDMLDVSRIAAGRLQLKYEKVNLVRLVDDVINQFHDDLRSRNIEVHFTAPETILCSVDRVRIEQVLINLLTNGMKYGGGKPIEVSVQERDGRGLIQVSDSGQGMAESFQARLFERYARENESGDIQGNGLGLWITSQIVKAHGGEISVRSQLNLGTTFTVELPLEAARGGELTL